MNSKGSFSARDRRGYLRTAACFLRSVNPQAVCDAGCGDGRMRAISPEATLWHGADLSIPDIMKAAKQYPESRFVVANAAKLPFLGGAYDAVVSCEVLEHVADERTFLRECARLLRPGGQLVLTTPHKGLFQFLDPSNFKFRVPWLHSLFYTLCGRRAEWKQRMLAGPEMVSNFERGSRRLWHRHYSISDLRALMDNLFVIEQVHRGGCLLYYLLWILRDGWAKLTGRHYRWMSAIADWDYSLECGSLAAGIAVRARKL